MISILGARSLVTLRIDGVAQQYSVVALNSTSSSLVNVSGGTIELGHGPSDQGTRLWIAHKESLAVDSYARFQLLGKRVSYTIDLSEVGCSCNAALYWVSMPGYSPDGMPAPGNFGNYYCDANKVGGVWCWEMDTIEANMHTMQVTPHSCSDPAGGPISSCDKSGSRRNSWFVDRKGLCPADDCLIDSRAPFSHTQSFVAVGNTLVRIENRLEQRGRAFAFNATSNSAYLAKMSEALRQGMVLTFQLWGGSWLLMSWLDYMTLCEGVCPMSSRVVYSNISIEAL